MTHEEAVSMAKESMELSQKALLLEQEVNKMGEEVAQIYAELGIDPQKPDFTKHEWFQPGFVLGEAQWAIINRYQDLARRSIRLSDEKQEILNKAKELNKKLREYTGELKEANQP